jgi:UTP--glucose-1-phosphate uridylyltransferase
VPNNKTGLVTGLIEKPNFKNAPSNLASIGRYVLTSDIFDILRNQSVGVGGEIQLADSINVQAENNMVGSTFKW